VLGDAETVRSYKSLALVERAFRCIKTVDLAVRPVHRWLADRVRGHVFLCMHARHFPAVRARVLVAKLASSLFGVGSDDPLLLGQAALSTS
jgi:transposase